MKKIFVTRRLLKPCEDKASKLFDIKLNSNDELYSQKKIIDMSEGCDGILTSLTEKMDEETINNTLIKEYDWETAVDTSTTWRIGDGTAGFYNYVYYTVAGFTEHDTFRSNQIREGVITRRQALDFIFNENRPRYQNIKWYLDTLGMNFEEVIKVVNSIPKLYKE